MVKIKTNKEKSETKLTKKNLSKVKDGIVKKVKKDKLHEDKIKLMVKDRLSPKKSKKLSNVQENIVKKVKKDKIKVEKKKLSLEAGLSPKKSSKLIKIKDGTVKKVKKDKDKIKLILKDKPSPKKISQLSKLKINSDYVRTAVGGLFKLTKETVSKKLFDDEYPVFIQVMLIKIPSCPDRIIRLPLKHSLLTDTSEICLIVPDLKKGRRVDYNPTVEHYEDILRENKITNINRIIPVNCIKTEYDQYELKRRLAAQYDLFLADGRICGHLAHLLGKAFYKKRKLPFPVHLQRPNLKNTIEKATKRTQMHIHGKGDNWLVQIGHSKMEIEDIVENYEVVCEELARVLPGGWKNVRAVYVKTHLSIAIPVYMTLVNANDMKVPKQNAKRPKAFKDAVGELSIMDAEVTVSPGGDIVMEKKKKQKT